MTPSRLLRALGTLLAVVALGACGEPGSSAAPAATVAGTDIAARVLVDEVEAIAGNDVYVEAFEASGTAVLAGDRDGSELATQFVSDTLGGRIQYEIVRQEVARRGLDPSGPCAEVAEQQMVDRFRVDEATSGEEVLAGFGEAYRSYLVDRHARFLALRADLAGISCGGEVSDEAVEAYFEENEEALTAEVACASHILLETRAEADEVVSLLSGGAEFAAVAAERSIDTGSGAAGGELGCTQAGRFVAPFDEALFSQPVGEVGEPVETEFGFHVILVTERSAPTEDELRQQIEAALVQEAEDAFRAWFTGALADTEVLVDPRYGDWDPVRGTIVRRPPDGPVIVDRGEG